MDQTVSTAPKRTLLRRLFYDQRFCWISALCTVGIMMLICYCYGLFPFGDSTILRMDLYHQYGPLFAELYDRVTGLKSLFYSWQTGLGSPFLGNYFNYLSSPSAIIILLLGHENMPESIAGMIIVKAALSACSFTYYLKRSQRRHDFTTAAFGILYAMCGYFVAYYWNVMWMDAMVYFPMVMLGIERIIHRRKPALYIAALALTLLSNYYMGYMTCVFSVIYYLIHYFTYYNVTTLDEATPYS
ncbi:MAG: YfhO family protein, partial [Clostridia bacterium]|nr:YfhO family protein [Clostridia bacterium]